MRSCKVLKEIDFLYRELQVGWPSCVIEKSLSLLFSGRFRDQIEKRKLLWQKAKEPEESAVKPNTAPVSLSTAAGSKSSKVYEATTFADGKLYIILSC